MEVKKNVIKSIKLRIYPNKSQIKIINGTLGCCRYIYNKYIEYNIELYKTFNKFIDGYEFSKYINWLKKNDSEYEWIKKYSSKAIKDAIMNADKSYKRFFNNKKGFPRFKSRKRIHKESYFFAKEPIKYITHNIIKIPILGRLRITQNYDLPNIEDVTSGRVIREYNKYYIILIYEYNNEYLSLTDNLLGIDLGLKNYCTIANSSYDIGTRFIKHFKNNPKYKKISDKIIKLQRIISKKAEINYYRLLNKWLDNNPTKELTENYKKIMKGESYNSSQIRKIFNKIRVLKNKLNNIRYDFINKTVNALTAITKPKCITVEDLNIMDMIKHNGTRYSKLHKVIQESSFYLFKTRLMMKCLEYGIKFRIVTQWYPSTKKCFICNHKFKNITLSDRALYCPNCGLEIDRDINAAYNMLNVKDKYCEIIS